MTREISYEKAGYYLEYLQFLRSGIETKASSSGLDINWMIDRLCTFLFESDFSKLSREYAINETVALHL